MTDDSENTTPLTMEHVHYILREMQYRMHNMESALIKFMELFLQDDTEENMAALGERLMELLGEFQEIRKSMPSHQAFVQHLGNLEKLKEKLRAQSH